MIDTSAINAFLLANDILIAENPAVSPDMCLDFRGLVEDISGDETHLSLLKDGEDASAVAKRCESVALYPKSQFTVEGIDFYLIESYATGDCALLALGELPDTFEKVATFAGSMSVVPLTWENFIVWKNYVQEKDPDSTIFPKAEGTLEKTSLGIGARFTTLHWPGVAWAMRNLGISITANQNSIPRELVFDPDAMMNDQLAQVPFPFIGRSVPEGHQGQTVHGMSHACVVTYLKLGFHKSGICWGFNADHQPIGGRFDGVEDELVGGSLFASYITYDLSPELSKYELIEDADQLSGVFEGLVDKGVYGNVVNRLEELGLDISRERVKQLVTYITPAMMKMKARDKKYTAIREKCFTTEIGRRFYKELSIDELPGKTQPETLGVCLAMAEAMGVKFHFIAPNIGFQKNFPYGDNDELRKNVEALYDVAQKFGASIGFHSGSGKSAENYNVCGGVTHGNFEVKTAGRYTYEMGKALSVSKDPTDHILWNDWYEFTKQLAIDGAFSDNETQQKFAREFIAHALKQESKPIEGVFNDRDSLSAALDMLQPSPDHMFWFEYNFLYVLAGEGSCERLGDHSAAGYRQRRRFYTISDEGKLLFAKNVASYIVFLAETTGMVDKEKADEARSMLSSYSDLDSMLDAVC